MKAVIAKNAGHEAVMADEIAADCKERLGAYGYPRVIALLDGGPKGPTGKLLERARA